MMARKTGDTDGSDRVRGKSTVAAAAGNAPFRGYINVNLTPEEKGAFAGWLDQDTFWSVVSGAIVDGVNVAVKPDPRQPGFLASATQRREDSVNAGLCVTARAGSPELALTRLAYVLALLGRSERWEDTQPLADPDRW